MRRAASAAYAQDGLAVRLTGEGEVPVVARVLPLAGGDVEAGCGGGRVHQPGGR